MSDETIAAEALKAYGTGAKMVTPAEFNAAIAEAERAPREDAALTRACIEALRSTGELLPRIPSMRVIVGCCPDGRPLPSYWSVLVEPGELPIIVAKLPIPFSGFVAVVARVSDLPKPKLTDAECDLIAERLVEALLQEEGRP